MGSNLVKFACIRRLVNVWLTRIGKISDGSPWHSNQQCHRKCDAWCRYQLWPLAGTLLAEGPIKGNIARAIWKSTGVSWVALSAVMVAQSCARQIAVLISQDVCFAPTPNSSMTQICASFTAFFNNAVAKGLQFHNYTRGGWLVSFFTITQ